MLNQYHLRNILTV